MLTEPFFLYGQPEPPAPLVSLKAGPLDMLYEPVTSMVRRIKLGEREVLRGIYVAVRDRNWGTVPCAIRETVRSIQSQSFAIEFDAIHQQGQIHFTWHGTIRGEEDGSIHYEFDGQALNNFLRNRIGFCVLHPIRECAGARARQSRTNGSTVETRFPDLIEPQIFGQSSFRNLRTVAHEISDGVWAELEFQGDTFEMEDQRNWTDASFKTYCTPLELPFPVEIAAGTRVQQSVTLRLREHKKITPTQGAGKISALAVPRKPNDRLPAIGLGVASHGEPLTTKEIETIRRLRPAHLRVDIRLANSDWQAKLQQAANEAEQLGSKLELALHLPHESKFELDYVTRVLAQHHASILRVLALREREPATSLETIRQVKKILGGLTVPVGAGSDCNFCELNREKALGRLAVAEADFLFWSVNPQVHAIDHLSVMETVEALPSLVRSARAFADDRPLLVSPITLKQRFNPVATGSETTPDSSQLPPTVDPRQLSLFGAAWTLADIATFSLAGLSSITLFETTGWRGVMERTAGSSLPEKFPSTPGAVFPLFHILAEIAESSSIASSISDNIVCLVTFASDHSMQTILLGNMDHHPHTISVPDISVRQTKQLVFPGVWGDLAFGERTKSFTLGPYAVAQLKP